MIDSPFYRINSPQSIDLLREIQALGHEIGLHYDVKSRQMKEATAKDRDEDIQKACEVLEKFSKSYVQSVSFHMPVPDLLNGPLKVGGRISGYAEPLFNWYLSDSRARWREGEPVECLKKARGTVLQILIHPIWWGIKNHRPEVRLRNFLEAIGPSLQKSYSELNEILWDHIVFRAESQELIK